MPTWRIYLFAFVVIAMAVSFAYLRLSGAKIAQPIESPLEQTVVSDVATLEQANPSFYQGVKEGDLVLRYEHRLDLYRPAEGRVIRSVVIGQ
jgi:hypothetical protein